MKNGPLTMAQPTLFRGHPKAEHFIFPSVINSLGCMTGMRHS